MTDEPTHHDRALPGDASGHASPAAPLPPESRAARSLTDRSKTGETSPDDNQAQPERAKGPRVWPRLAGVLILLLGVGGAWIWQKPEVIPTSLRSMFSGSFGHDPEATGIETLEARVAKLERRPVPADLTPLMARLDALEKRAVEAGQAGGRPVGQMSSQPAGQTPSQLMTQPAVRSAEPPISQTPGPSLSPPVDLRPLLARLDALEKNASDHTVDLGPIGTRLDAISSRVEALSARDPAAELRSKLDDVERQLSGLAANDTKMTDGASRAIRLARLEAAGVVLAAGRALGPLLGSIPDAPPALTRFATTRPPTEATLRLTFAAASRDGLKVSLPDTEGKPFLDRIMARLQDFRLITVREGDQVLIGNSAAATLVRARMLLDAGDLSGAITTVATLSGPPADKMAPWLADATALAAAREALASLAERG